MPPNAGAPPDFFSAQIAEAKRFYLDFNPPPSLGLAVLCGGREHCSSAYEIHRESFPYWSIEFVAQGHGWLTLRGAAVDLVAGTVFCYGPGIAHDIVSDPDDPLVKYFVDFTGREVEIWLRRHGPAPGKIQQTAAPGEVLAVFDELVRNGLLNTPFTGLITAALLQVLILKIAETAIPFGAASTPAFATYRRCRQWVDERWQSIQSLEELASACHVDPAYLCRLFRRFGHQSPYQYLLRRKMAHAAELLLLPQASVKQVAEDAGFGDPFHFSRMFKKVMGLSPAQFARANRFPWPESQSPGTDPGAR